MENLAENKPLERPLNGVFDAMKEMYGLDVDGVSQIDGKVHVWWCNTPTDEQRLLAHKCAHYEPMVHRF